MDKWGVVSKEVEKVAEAMSVGVLLQEGDRAWIDGLCYLNRCGQNVHHTRRWQRLHLIGKSDTGTRAMGGSIKVFGCQGYGIGAIDKPFCIVEVNHGTVRLRGNM